MEEQRRYFQNIEVCKMMSLLDDVVGFWNTSLTKPVGNALNMDLGLSHFKHV